LQKQLVDALAYAEENPEDYEGVTERLENAAAAGAGTEVEARAAEAIRRSQASDPKRSASVELRPALWQNSWSWTSRFWATLRTPRRLPVGVESGNLPGFVESTAKADGGR